MYQLNISSRLYKSDRSEGSTLNFCHVATTAIIHIQNIVLLQAAVMGRVCQGTPIFLFKVTTNETDVLVNSFKCNLDMMCTICCSCLRQKIKRKLGGKILSSGRLTGSKALPYLKHLVNTMRGKSKSTYHRLVQEIKFSVMCLSCLFFSNQPPDTRGLSS